MTEYCPICRQVNVLVALKRRAGEVAAIRVYLDHSMQGGDLCPMSGEDVPPEEEPQ